MAEVLVNRFRGAIACGKNGTARVLGYMDFDDGVDVEIAATSDYEVVGDGW